MEPIILRYPIPGNNRGGLLHIYGNNNANNIVLYCGGYPDGVEPFTPLARRLATSNGNDGNDDDGGGGGCFVGITCWPGFDNESFRQTKFHGFRREGYSFDEVGCCIRESATLLFAEYNKITEESDNNISNDEDGPIKKPQFTVIFHDFGVVAGMAFVNRTIEEKYFFEHKPDRIVLLDVLIALHRKFDRPKEQYNNIAPYTNRENLVYLAYRGRNAYSFVTMRYISEIAGVIAYWFLTCLVRMLRLEPLFYIDEEMLARRQMSTNHLVYMAYPYYYLFHALMYDKRAMAHASLPLDLVRMPILYIYGTEKNVMFHDRRSLAILEREEMEGRSDCRVVKVDGAGHWMYCQRPEVCEQEIRKFLRSGKHDLDDEVVHEGGRMLSKL